jgi:hypothetical protein
MNQNRNIVELCDPYFWEQPSVLVGDAWFKRWSRKSNNTCASEIVNEITTIYIFTFILATTVSIFIEYPLALPIALLASTLYLVPAFLQLTNIQLNSLSISTSTIPNVIKETFVDIDIDDDNNNYTNTNTNTNPTAKNPFMNVSINDIKYNPNKPSATSISSPDIQDTLDSFFRVQWISDPTDVFGKSQSQREFITMPSTSIPNDQESYQNWLYKIPGKTCKEGGREACLSGTDGGPVTWLNEA